MEKYGKYVFVPNHQPDLVSDPDHPDLSDLTTTERSGFEMPGMLGPSETLLRSQPVSDDICSQFLQSKLLLVICKTMDLHLQLMENHPFPFSY